MGQEKERSIAESDKRRETYVEEKFWRRTFPNRFPSRCSKCGQGVPIAAGMWTQGKVLCSLCGDYLTQASGG